MLRGGNLGVMSPDDEAAKEPSFEEVLQRLGQVAESLEKSDVPLEKALALFEEGVRLSRRAQERLAAAEAKIEELTERGTTRPVVEPAKKR